MKRALPLALFLPFLLGVTSAHAFLEDVAIDPAEPIEDQVVTVTATSVWGDGCFHYDRTEWSVEGFDVTVDVYIVDQWQPGGGGIAIVVDYPITAELGVLDPGTYQLRVVEHRTSLRVDPIETVELEFVVERSVADDGHRWSTLKASYR